MSIKPHQRGGTRIRRIQVRLRLVLPRRSVFDLGLLGCRCPGESLIARLLLGAVVHGEIATVLPGYLLDTLAAAPAHRLETPRDQRDVGGGTVGREELAEGCRVFDSGATARGGPGELDRGGLAR